MFIELMVKPIQKNLPKQNAVASVRATIETTDDKATSKTGKTTVPVDDDPLSIEVAALKSQRRMQDEFVEDLERRLLRTKQAAGRDWDLMPDWEDIVGNQLDGATLQ